MASVAFLRFLLLCLLASSIRCYNIERGLNPLARLLKKNLHKKFHVSQFSVGKSSVYMGTQDGLKELDKIDTLPGQPDGVDFDQYSGYVTVDPHAGRALFYYFVESPTNASSKPLVMWLNGGPGCSSLGGGAMMELGPFRVNKDGATLYRNEFAWNNEANIIFLESPAGVGFSYSNTTSDYASSGDNRTAIDSYTFLVNWLERFPEYKTRDFYIAGESYAGHYVPQLAQTILHNNENANQTIINLKGIAIGNALIDDDTTTTGSLDFIWSHALLSDEIYFGILSNCNFSAPILSNACVGYLDQINGAVGNIYDYDIYAPLCNSSASSFRPISSFDPCSGDYIEVYLNIPEVQEALHTKIGSFISPWTDCNSDINNGWNDSPATLLPTIQELIDSGMLVYIYSGDTDFAIPITVTRYGINKLKGTIQTSWYPWYHQGEVGGYAVGYEGFSFISIRGSGHFVPSYQPARALAFFSAFLQGKLPPSS